MVDSRRTFSATDITYQARNGDEEPGCRARVPVAKMQVFVKIYIATRVEKSYYALSSHSNKNVSTQFNNTQIL